MNELELLREKLGSQEWRLNNLYWIKNERGERVKFKMNDVQKEIYGGLHYLNVFLKARQLGVTTFTQMLLLDYTLFKMWDCGVIAHTTGDASKFFEDKIKYAWDNLPEGIKAGYSVDTNNARTLKFKIGKKESSIYVGTSLRSATCQALHISELSTIDQKYPEKAVEIRTGALNTVHAGQYIFMESTAKGRYGVFHDICDLAMGNQGKSLTPLDYKFFFFPWFDDKRYRLKLEKDSFIPSDIRDYCNGLEKDLGIKIDEEQRLWYYKKKLVQKEEMFREYPSTPEEAFKASIEGAYYGRQIGKARTDKRIRNVPYDSLLPVDTYWDLGMSDSTAIIFVQNYGLETRIIDCYENSGEGLAHYIKVLSEKEYIYGRHVAPHDIEVRELGTGRSRREMAQKLGIHFQVAPKLSLLDGIEAVRNILGQCWFDEEKTDKLIKALSEYRREWDDKIGDWKDNPLHNWTSHFADSTRTMAVSSYGRSFAEIKRVDEGRRKTIEPDNLFDNYSL